MYFDWLSERNEGKKIKDLFPNLQVIVHGGVNFEPYKSKLIDSLGGEIDMIETFPASEGFFAFQGYAGQGRAAAEYGCRHFLRVHTGRRDRQGKPYAPVAGRGEGG